MRLIINEARSDYGSNGPEYVIKTQLLCNPYDQEYDFVKAIFDLLLDVEITEVD